MFSGSIEGETSRIKYVKTSSIIVKSPNYESGVKSVAVESNTYYKV